MIAKYIERISRAHVYEVARESPLTFAATLSTRKLGVIAASAGNRVQGVALAAAKLKIPALIVIPITTAVTALPLAEC